MNTNYALYSLSHVFPPISQPEFAVSFLMSLLTNHYKKFIVIIKKNCEDCCFTNKLKFNNKSYFNNPRVCIFMSILILTCKIFFHTKKFGNKCKYFLFLFYNFERFLTFFYLLMILRFFSVFIVHIKFVCLSTIDEIIEEPCHY